jgi:hypothetical protein
MVSSKRRYFVRIVQLTTTRWHVHRRARHHWIRLGLQYHGRAHTDYGARISHSKSAHGEHLQLAMESGSYRSCLDHLWNLSNHEQLGVENSIYTPGTLQHCPNRLLLVDC